MGEQFYFRTGDQALVRQINLSIIMRSLRENAPISRAALAEITGLNKTTVSSLVKELIDKEFVREIGLEESNTGRGAGRLAMLLTLDPEAGYIVSIEMGVDFLSVVCTNFAPEIIWQFHEEIQPDQSQQAIIDRMLALSIQAEQAGCESCKSFLGAGLGVPGIVDQSSGALLFAPNLGWRDVPLKDMLEEKLSAPVFVNNEASMSALGEFYFGAAQGYKNILYISVGVGLGGGVVHDGLVYSGVDGFGTEFGHMTMDTGGDLCKCGNRGCWETLVSQRKLFQYIEDAINDGAQSNLTERTQGDLKNLTVPMVVAAARENDHVAIRALNKIGVSMGIGIASLVNALNPDLVVFGGIMSLASEFILPIVEEELRLRALRWNLNSAKIVTAKHGPDACVMGGVAQVYQTILAEPNWISSGYAWSRSGQLVDV